MDRSKQLGEEKIGKLLMKFSIPAIVGMLVNALYNVIDRMFIGHIGGGIGKIAISGVAVTFPISNIIMAFGMLVGIGTAALISIKLGQQKKRRGRAYFRKCIYSNHYNFTCSNRYRPYIFKAYVTKNWG